MRRDKLFTIRVNSEERRMISELAAKLQRSQSDAIRFVVSEALNLTPRDYQARSNDPINKVPTTSSD